MDKNFTIMKKLLLPTALLAFLNAYSQVGINTQSPSATFDVVSKGNTNTTKALEINDNTNKELVGVDDDGTVRFSKYKNFTILGTDANGNLVSGTTISIPSIAAIATGIPSSSNINPLTYPKYTFTVDKINATNLSYSNGDFTVLKAGYYSISAYTNKDLTMNGSTTGGTFQTFIVKTIPSGTNIYVSRFSVNVGDNTGFENNSLAGTSYFNVGDKINIQATYSRTHKLSAASLNIVYYGT